MLPQSSGDKIDAVYLFIRYLYRMVVSVYTYITKYIRTTAFQMSPVENERDKRLKFQKQL